MPETNKTDKFDYGLPNALGIVRDRGKQPEQASSPATNPPETTALPVIDDADRASEPLPDVAEVGVIDDFTQDDFAKSVMFGLEQAGFGSDEGHAAEALIPETTEEPDEPDEDVDDDTFFAGWGSDTIIPAEPKADVPEPVKTEKVNSPAVSPFEMSLAASSSRLAAEYEEPEYDIASKHDALADAVQSALLNLYGDGAPQSRAPEPEPMRVPEFYSNGKSKTGAITGEDGDDFDDGVSPQDVILNYFTYSSDDTSSELLEYDSVEESPRQRSTQTPGPRAVPSAREHHGSVEPLPQSVSRAFGRGESATQASARYQGMHSFPVPVTRAPEPPAERESGRLLGAAGIGLVGGIAIAATLAVFVINSYGPQDRPSSFGNEKKQEEARAPRAESALALPEAPRRVQETGLAQVASEPPVRNESPAKLAAQPASDSQGDIVATDAVGGAGQSVALSIAVKSPRPQDQTLVSITGLPEGARLNVGVDAGGGNWLLPPRRLSGLTMNLPADAPNVIPLEVQLLDSNVRIPLSEKKEFTVRVNPTSLSSQKSARDAPGFETQTLQGSAADGSSQEAAFGTKTVPTTRQAAAMPGFQTSALPSMSANNPPDAQAGRPASQAEIEDSIREGNKRMKEGDILKAREFYLKAVGMGEPEAALAMGRSYDPIYFTRLDKKNAEPDPAAAFEWYRKAMDGGATQTAKVRIENLRHYLNE